LGIRTKPSPGGVRSLPQARSASGVEGEAKRVRSNFVGLLEGTVGGVSIGTWRKRGWLAWMISLTFWGEGLGLGSLLVANDGISVRE
jgi:hypothetical protein